MLGTRQLGTFELGTSEEEEFGGKFGQAQAIINILGRGFGQAQPWIKQTSQKYGQAQAHIKQITQAYSQAGALVDQRFQFAQVKSTVSGISFVQSNSISGDAAGGNQILTLAKAPTPGNLLVAVYSSRNTNSSTVYTLDNGIWIVAERRNTGSNQWYTELSYQIVPPGGLSATTTLNVSNSAQVIPFGIAEFSGINTTDPFITATGIDGAAVNSINITPSQLVETLLIGTVEQRVDGGTTNLIPVSPNIEWMDTANGSFGPYQGATYRIVTIAEGMYTVGFNGTEQTALIAAAFRGRFTLGVGQAQGFIGQLFRGFGQAQAKLNSFGYPQFGQAQANIKATSKIYGQALAFIGHYKFGNAQAKINSFDQPHFGQAQALIYHSIGLANARAWIKQTYRSVANAQGFILPNTGKGQAQVWIKQTYPLMSLDVNYALTTMGATAVDSIGQTIEPTYVIDGNDYGYRWTIVGIAQDQYVEIDFGQERTINYYRILPVTFDATVSIQVLTIASPTWITLLTVPQFNVDFFADIDTSRVEAQEFPPYTTRKVRILVIDDGSNTGISLSTVELGWATVKSPTSAQAQAFFGHFGVAQAQARVSPGRGIATGQAKADIVETFTRRGNANAWIIKPQVYGQTVADILQQYRAYAQVPAWIIPPTVIAQALATIKAYNVGRFGQAKADIEATINKFANAKAFIHKAISHGNAQAQIKSSRIWKFGQARARIGNYQHGYARAYIIKGQGYGQAKADIKVKTLRFAQAQAQIRQVKGYGQAQAQLMHTYFEHGYGLAIINQTFGIAQAQANINQIYNALGQANARIRNIATNYSNPYGQAQSMVHYRRYVSAQAQAYISPRHFAVGQAQAFINNFKIGQAQARITSVGYVQVAQTQAYISVNTDVPVPTPSSDAHSYLTRFNNYDLPGYAQEESYDSIQNIGQHPAMKIDGSLSQYLGLQNKNITLRMRVWEPTYYQAKERVQKAAIMLRSMGGFAKLYIQQPDAYFLALVKSIQIQKDASESNQVMDYLAQFEAKPWLISNDTYEISGTGLISTSNRTLEDGGWTPTRIIVSGTDVEIIATTDTGDPAGHIEIDGDCTNLVIDSDAFITVENGLNTNAKVLTKDFGIYVGPGVTNFQVNGATSCVIQWNNRWYLASTRGTSTQPIAITPIPTPVITAPQKPTGLAAAVITSGIKQGFGLSRAYIFEPIKKKSAQTQALIHSPITNAYGQVRAFLRSGRTWTFAQSQAGIRVTGSRGLGQSRAFIEGNTKYKSAQARVSIRAVKQVKFGQARAKIVGLPPAPSNFTATPGDTIVTLTWS